ncbi:hypothetical protein [Microcoleus sp. OTE_8_concoct_300]|uniref:hypothetical protein n=1 Tax=Microcoleus sp. OTE_8_concoct_300 TaxID=2964710 RepID=UPI00403F2E91
MLLWLELQCSNCCKWGRKFGNGFCNGCNGCNGCQEEGRGKFGNGCNGCQEEGRRKKEEGGRKKEKTAIPVSVTSVSWIQAIGKGELGIGNWE